MSYVGLPSKPIVKPKDGARMGDQKGEISKKYNNKQFSRVTDALFAAQQAGLDYRDVLKLFKNELRYEWMYTAWSYVS